MAYILYITPHLYIDNLIITYIFYIVLKLSGNKEFDWEDLHDESLNMIVNGHYINV